MSQDQSLAADHHQACDGRKAVLAGCVQSRFSDEQIIAMIREHESGVKTADICRKYGLSDATFYKLKAKFGGMTVSDAQRLRTLETENSKLKRLLAEAMLDNAALKDIASKNF
jgi:putative transposase